MSCTHRKSPLVVAAVLAAAISLGAAVCSPARAADPQQPVMNPATGQPPGAPTGCCCLPKLHPTADDRFDCKPKMTEFDCKAECAEFKDGRLPSGCKWSAGDCAR